MSYSSQSLIESKIGTVALLEVTDKEGTGTIDTAAVTRKLAAADSYIHSYIMARYSSVIPFSTTPAIIQDMATDIAVYLLYKDSQMGANQERKDEFKAATDYLKDVQAGKATIDGVTIQHDDARNTGETLYDSTRTRTFSRESLNGM